MCTICLAKDQTIRIWNYETGKVELVKKYQVDVTAIALHPSGIFVAVGFNDQLRLMEILLDDLKVTPWRFCIIILIIIACFMQLTKTFNFPKCKSTEFSHEGHMLGCAYDDLITIVSVFSFDVIRTLKVTHGY